MKRNVSTVAREIADCLPLFAGGPHKERLQRWLLLLAPPKRKVRPRDPARSARRATVKELDALCREVTFLRDQGLCRRCGKTATDWCHVHTRGTHATRWDLDNVFAGCNGCHRNFWHKQPLKAAAWWEQEIGTRRYNALMLKTSTKGRGKVNLMAVKKYLEDARKELGA